MDFYKMLDLQVREGGVAISATELGDGVQNAIVLVILRAFEERRKRGAILLIEEPEMFLHPQMQRSLYNTLREIGATKIRLSMRHSRLTSSRFRSGNEAVRLPRSQWDKGPVFQPEAGA